MNYPSIKLVYLKATHADFLKASSSSSVAGRHAPCQRGLLSAPQLTSWCGGHCTEPCPRVSGPSKQNSSNSLAGWLQTLNEETPAKPRAQGQGQSPVCPARVAASRDWLACLREPNTPKRTERGANQTADKGTECLKRREECLPESWAEKNPELPAGFGPFFHSGLWKQHLHFPF